MRRRWAAALATLVVAATVTSCTADDAAPPSTAVPLRPAPTSPVAAEPARHTLPTPNIVFVLMDDFSAELLPTMRNAQALAARGATYPSSFVVDSLCCVSRAATFTG